MPANAVAPGDVCRNRSLRKQIGCMNNIFQIFDRQHKHRRLLFSGQHQLEPHNAADDLPDNDMEVQKQEPRITPESSQVSDLPSSLDCIRTDISESSLHITENKENKASMSQSRQSPHICNVVKDSMHREARGVHIKSFKMNSERKVTVMKHVDSPRPIQKLKSEKPKGKSHEELELKSNHSFSRDERLIHRRLSFDGREPRDGAKMKNREFHRLSLDSKVNSVKCSSLDLRSDVLGQESGGHSRTSSIVAKLMGLEDFPNAIATDDSNVTVNFLLPDSRKATEENREKQALFLKSARPSRLPMEPAPWKQKDPSQGSPYSSVYGEMEKRITELEFKRSGNDLRALKQILEAMQKTRDKLEKERQELTEPEKENQLCSSNKIPNVAKATGKDKNLNSGKVLKMKKMDMQSHEEYPACSEKTKEIRPNNGDMKGPRRCFSSMDKKTTLKNSELKQTTRAPQRKRLDNYAVNRRGFEMATPKSQQKHSDKKVGETCSLRKNAKLKSTGLIQHCYQGEMTSVESESNNSSALDLETKPSSLARSTNQNCIEKQKSPASKEHEVALMEQPSPVSVLDTAFCIEETLSPVKKKSTVFRGLDGAEWALENLCHFTDKKNQKPHDTSDVIQVPALSKTKPTAEYHNEEIYQNFIQDKRYIKKVLAASGLFKDTCMKPTNPISPVIFHVLEEMEENDDKKMQRRAIFDTVNEILARKITADGRKRRGSQWIMRELYLEMDRLCGMARGSGDLDDEDDDGSIRLLNADIKYGLDGWTDYEDEVHANVLEIERMIFKDLINEVVNGQIERHLLLD